MVAVDDSVLSPWQCLRQGTYLYSGTSLLRSSLGQPKVMINEVSTFQRELYTQFYIWDLQQCPN